MAKRARGSVRPGQRRPIDKRPASPAAAASTAAAAPRPAGLSDAELERAAQLEAELLAQEKAAEQARTRTRARATRETVVPAAAGSLAVASKNEYAYVGRDVRDIVRIASLLIGILVVLWLVIDVFAIVPLGG
jgi:hypothetical protein